MIIKLDNKKQQMINELVDQIRYEDLLSLSKKLKGLLVEHVEWLKTLQKTMICNLPISSSSAEQHRNCSFGRWYYSVSLPLLIENSEFICLGDTHKRLHTIADSIITEYRRNKTVGEKEYDLFSMVQKDFIVNFEDFIENILSTKSQYDHLTNLPNRSLISAILEKEHSKAIRNIGKSYVGFTDVDNFKNINDSYGHLAGDKVLKAVAHSFEDLIRDYDTVGRYGGEEFIFCFPEIELNEATALLERLRIGIERLSIRIDESNIIKVTCSFGLAEMRADESLMDVIKKADNAMYLAKESGRNKIKIWNNLMP